MVYIFGSFLNASISYSFCERQVRHLGRQIRRQVGQSREYRVMMLVQ